MSAFPYQHSYSMHHEHYDVAQEIHSLFNKQVDKAMTAVSTALGFDPFTRDLDDYKMAYGLVVPPVLYDDNKDLCDALADYVKAVFRTHYVNITVGQWREPMTYRDLDCVGSRSRDLDIPHHYYMELNPYVIGTRRPPLDPSDMEPFPYKWTLDLNADDAYHYYIKIASLDGTNSAWKTKDGETAAEPGNTAWESKHGCDDDACSCCSE
jgi:hypothetical protein